MDALLGVVAKKTAVTRSTSAVSATGAEQIDAAVNEDETAQSSVVAADSTDEPEVKTETNESAVTAPPVVVFKKRKAPRR